MSESEIRAAIAAAKTRSIRVSFDLEGWRRDNLMIDSAPKELSDAAKRRFQINPEPLKMRGEIPKADYNAGRCDQIQKDGLRCNNDAKWCVLMSRGPLAPTSFVTPRTVCGVHVRALRDHPRTAIVRPL